MTTDREAREAAARAGALASRGVTAKVNDRDREVASAAIDAYNAKLREGMSDERGRLRAALFAWWDSLGPNDGVVADPLIDAILAALSAQRQDHTELIAAARTWDSAITQAAPTTTVALIQKLADALEGKSDE